MEQFRDHIGTILETFRDHVGIILLGRVTSMAIRHRRVRRLTLQTAGVGIILGSVWDHFGIILGSFWDLWDHFGSFLGGPSGIMG